MIDLFRRLAEDWKAFYIKLDAEESSDGSLTPEQSKHLAYLMCYSETGIDSACDMLKSLEAEETALREEAARLTARARRLDRLQGEVSAALQTVVQAIGGRVKTPRYTLAVHPGKPTVTLSPTVKPADLPESLQRTVEPTLDKEAAARFLKEDPQTATMLGLEWGQGKPFLVRR